MEVTRIIAVRHGETAWNVDGRVQGHLDIGLNDKGRWQATRAGDALAQEDISTVYTSDLWRAYDTALAIATPHGLPIQTHEGLRERGFGEFEGKTYEEIAALWPDQSIAWRKRVPDFSPQGGESLLMFRARVVPVVQQLAARHMGEQIVVIAHGGVMDMLYRAATNQDISASRTWELGNAAINRLLWNGEHFSLVGWADVSHLDDAVCDERRG
jgi:2,3-bisphosphoglycerate-dependent phosphoglycerate mutase